MQSSSTQGSLCHNAATPLYILNPILILYILSDPYRSLYRSLYIRIWKEPAALYLEALMIIFMHSCVAFCLFWMVLLGTAMDMITFR